MTATGTQTCYRHPSRETGVSCSSCGRPICPECMTPTPVGMRCPECAKQRTPVRTMRNVGSEPRVTIAIIVLCVVVFLAEGSFGFNSPSGTLFDKGALFGPAVQDGQYYRLITSGFLHVNLLHIAFNLYLLWILGQMLEPALGSLRFAALYFTSLLWGSFGALVLQPDALTVGASGAIFGLMGAAAVELRARGVNPFKTDIGLLILVNLVFSFVISNVSVGGHIGGLIGGVLVGLVYDFADRRRGRLIAYAGCLVLAAAGVAGAVAVA